jgi:hypothetical protein
VDFKTCKLICDGCGKTLGHYPVSQDGPDEIETSSEGDYHADRCNNCHPYKGNCRDCGDPMYKGIGIAWVEDDEDPGEFYWTCC